MTFFGIIWLTVLLFYIIKVDIKKMAVVTLISMVLQSSNVIAVGTVFIGPQMFSCAALIILFCIRNKKLIIQKPKICTVAMFMFIIFVGISMFFNRVLILNVLKYIQLVVYAVTVLIFKNLAKEFNDIEIYDCLKNITWFVLIMGIIQFLTTSDIMPGRQLMKILIYNDNSESCYYNYYGYYRVMSTFLEPSYCGCFLVGIFYYFLSCWKNSKKDLKLLVFIAIEIFGTLSSTAYGSLIIVGFIFLLFSSNKKVKRIILPIGIILSIFLYIVAYDILNQVIFSKTTSGSFITRYYWNLQAQKMFESSRYIGVGYKSVRASSMYYSLLAQVGIIGFVIYIFYNLLAIATMIQKKNRKRFGYIGVRFSLLAVIVGQFIACPDFEFCVYWMFLYVLALHGIERINLKS